MFLCDFLDKELRHDPFTPTRQTAISGIVIVEYEWDKGSYIVFVGDQSTHLSYDEVVYNLTERPESFREGVFPHE